MFIDRDNHSAQWRRRVQDSVGGSSVKFPSNQDSGFHKTIPVRAKQLRPCDACLSNRVKKHRAMAMDMCGSLDAAREAFRSGNLGVMDYYRLNNIKADTDMRESISKGDRKK